jgi:hypothetical protein
MQCILYKIYFWKVFHIYYNLICILYALLCGQNFILVKSGCYTQYGSYHSDTVEKKMAMLHQGLNPVLHEHLTLFHDCTLNELMSASIEQEDACRAHIEEERRKRPPLGPTWSASSKYHLVYTPPLGQPHGPPPS